MPITGNIKMFFDLVREDANRQFSTHIWPEIIRFIRN